MEGSDHYVLKIMLSEAVERLLNDPDIAEFGTYFSHVYSRNILSLGRTLTHFTVFRILIRTLMECITPQNIYVYKAKM